MVLLVLLAPAAAPPSWSQTPGGGWEILRRVSAEHDVPSSDAERARTPLAPDPARLVYFVRPQDTDPRIDHFLKDHYVLFYRTIPSSGRLFVFFPGTWARPSQYQYILDEAARAGYDALGLEYPDDTDDPTASAVGQICVRDPDPECSARVRTARILGGDASGVHVSPPNSIQNRLEKVLAYLTLQHPGEGWDRFLTHGRVNWERLTLAGHSQGAGMAAFLAKGHAVARVALFSGPADYVGASGRLAPWLAMPAATPPERWYALVHREEPGAARLLEGYATLGVPGVPAVADAAVPAATHRFIVTLSPRPGPALPLIANAYHGSVAVDARTPVANGEPAYRSVWQAMIGR